ncbi:hypothetical protein VB773_19715 [Haloarculaceae archaeon H-GB2-1]|nr:hypothetical protein [Haloarculaceae archaeon H-GB2-1]
MAKELSDTVETAHAMGWKSEIYDENYKNKVNTYTGQNPEDVMAVVLNEEAPVASKRQFCAKVPAYRPEEGAKYSARSPNDFLRLEELALLYPVPATSKNQHFPAVHPDVRCQLRELLAKGLLSPIDLQDDETEDWVALGPEYRAIEKIEQRSEEIANAAFWYVGRAVDRNVTLPYGDDDEQEEEAETDDERSYGDINYFALKAFLFSQVAPYYTQSQDAEITLHEPLGKTGRGTYEIKGTFEAPASELKPPEELDQDGVETQSDVEEALIAHVEDTLISLFRLGMFQPDDIPEKTQIQ